MTMNDNDPNKPKRSALAAGLIAGAFFAIVVAYFLAVTFIDH